MSRDETPFMSSIGRTKATAIFHEWQTDELAVPAAGQVAEGVSFATQAAAQAAEPFRTRLGNYCQINSKTVQVTGTKRAVDQAGVADEYAYQLKKRGVEMKRDQEFGLVSTNQSSSSGSPRTFGGYQAWMNHNVKNVLTTANEYTAPTNPGGGVAGTYTTVTSGDTNPLQLSHVDTLMQTIYEQGGRATKLMTSPANRRAFSARAQAAGSAVEGTGPGNVRRNIDTDGKLRQSVEIYMSDFGDVMVVPNYVMGLSYTSVSGLADTANFFAFLYDPMWFSWATLRPMQEVDLGQLGDSIIGQIVEEGTLECKNPKGAGLILGLSGT
ncbi:MAG TPA: DUF5309 family protein [Mesotoga sp.]|nr:DUF5309 family protein [Mesotoga sp.]